MSKESIQKQRRTFTPEFKQQIVDLHSSGKRKCDISREYDLGSTLLDRWIKQAENSNSFKESDNRSPLEEELLALRKQNRQLEMENDILYPEGHAKQAALIMGRR